ncbi:hypothetical protein [Lysinibacillus sp. 54212]|uniref:hypothetical protein n=1 Tax=Lysinibacillus sp. 54212 TaxID=3119829 RepID=UPI002FCC915A
MSIQKTNNILNLASLQERLDSTVFDYVDTTQNWGKAKESLQELLGQAVDYLTMYTKDNGGLPKSSPYWVLFMDFASRLVYFNALVDENLVDPQNDVAKVNIRQAYLTAANCLPNNHFDENAEFFNEIQKSYNSLNEAGTGQQIEKGIHSLNDCLNAFYQFTLTYKK